MAAAALPTFTTCCVARAADNNLGAEGRSNRRSDTDLWHGRASRSTALASLATCQASRAKNDGLSAESSRRDKSRTRSLNDYVTRALTCDRPTSSARAVNNALSRELGDCRRCDDARVSTAISTFSRKGVCVEGGSSSGKNLCAVSIVGIVPNELRSVEDGLVRLISDCSSVGRRDLAVFAVRAIVIFGNASVVDHDRHSGLAGCVDCLRIGPSKRPGGEVRKVPTAIAREVCGEVGTSRVCLAIRDVRRVSRDTLHRRAPCDDGRRVNWYRSSRFSHYSAEHGSKICGVIGGNRLVGCHGLSASSLSILLVDTNSDALQDSNVDPRCRDTVSCVCGGLQDTVISRGIEVCHSLANRRTARELRVGQRASSNTLSKAVV